MSRQSTALGGFCCAEEKPWEKSRLQFHGERDEVACLPACLPALPPRRDGAWRDHPPQVRPGAQGGCGPESLVDKHVSPHYAEPEETNEPLVCSN